MDPPSADSFLRATRMSKTKDEHSNGHAEVERAEARARRPEVDFKNVQIRFFSELASQFRLTL